MDLFIYSFNSYIQRGQLEAKQKRKPTISFIHGEITKEISFARVAQ